MAHGNAITTTRAKGLSTGRGERERTFFARKKEAAWVDEQRAHGESRLSHTVMFCSVMKAMMSDPQLGWPISRRGRQREEDVE